MMRLQCRATRKVEDRFQTAKVRIPRVHRHAECSTDLLLDGDFLWLHAGVRLMSIHPGRMPFCQGTAPAK